VAAVIGIAFLIEQLPKEPLAKLFLSPEISQIHQSRPSGTGFQPVMAQAEACGYILPAALWAIALVCRPGMVANYPIISEIGPLKE